MFSFVVLKKIMVFVLNACPDPTEPAIPCMEPCGSMPKIYAVSMHGFAWNHGITYLIQC